MSHLEERKERNCLNCNAEIYGKYCHICGQENIEPKENAWHLVSHFFQDITHFDGKFFSTLKYLVLKPGYLPGEYMRGRRASYLNPVRMYVFSSALFFLIFFSLFKVHKDSLTVGSTIHGKTIEQVDAMNDTAFKRYTSEVNAESKKAYKPMTREEFKAFYLGWIDSSQIQFTDARAKTAKAYNDSLAAGVYDDGWIKRQFVYLQLRLNERYKGNSRELFGTLANNLLHTLPQLLFVSLPLFALLLKLLYIRRKQFYYVNHAIFSVHLFIFLFIALLCIFGINSIVGYTGWNWLWVFRMLLVLSIFFYCYKGMRNFYGQGRFKTISKFLLLMISFSIVILILFVAFAVYSLFKL